MTLYSSVMAKIDALKVPSRLRRPIVIGWTLVHDLIRCDLTRHASAMAYVSLLSLIPSLVAFFCILSLFAPMVGNGTGLVERAREFILSNLAASSGDAVVSYLDRMLSSLNLKTIGWSSFASVMVTLILLLRQIEEALNRIWLITKGRNVFKRFFNFWAFLTLGLVVLGLVIGVTAADDVKRLMSLQKQVASDSGVLGRTVGFVGAFSFFFFLYKVVPNCRVRARDAAVGAVVSATLLGVASVIYAAFVINAKNYQTLYGALAQLPIFLMWLYVCWIIILLGALVSWRMQEGFPRDKDSGESLDTPSTPLEELRNVQLKACLPLLVLLAIHERFESGNGRGLSAQDLAHQAKVPLGWVSEALASLVAMGYVVAGRSNGDDDAESTADDPYFPSYPASRVSIARLEADLARPITAWTAGWEHELPEAVPRMLRVLGGATGALRTAAPGVRPEATLADVLRQAG